MKKLFGILLAALCVLPFPCFAKKKKNKPLFPFPNFSFAPLKNIELPSLFNTAEKEVVLKSDEAPVASSPAKRKKRKKINFNLMLPIQQAYSSGCEYLKSEEGRQFVADAANITARYAIPAALVAGGYYKMQSNHKEQMEKINELNHKQVTQPQIQNITKDLLDKVNSVLQQLQKDQKTVNQTQTDMSRVIIDLQKNISLMFTEIAKTATTKDQKIEFENLEKQIKDSDKRLEKLKEMIAKAATTENQKEHFEKVASMLEKYEKLLSEAKTIMLDNQNASLKNEKVATEINEKMQKINDTFQKHSEALQKYHTEVNKGFGKTKINKIGLERGKFEKQFQSDIAANQNSNLTPEFAIVMNALNNKTFELPNNVSIKGVYTWDTDSGDFYMVHCNVTPETSYSSIFSKPDVKEQWKNKKPEVVKKIAKAFSIKEDRIIVQAVDTTCNSWLEQYEW